MHNWQVGVIIDNHKVVISIEFKKVCPKSLPGSCMWFCSLKRGMMLARVKALACLTCFDHVLNVLGNS